MLEGDKGDVRLNGFIILVFGDLDCDADVVDKYLTKSNFVEVSKPNCSSNRLAARLELPCSGATATVDPLLVTMFSAFVSKRLP